MRLLVLGATGLLDSPPEVEFDRFTRLAARLLGCPVSLFSLVDRDRQFFKSSVGLESPWKERRQTGLQHSFCQHVVTSGAPLIVSDARNDDRVCDNLAIRDLGVIAYLGVPVRSADGSVLGSFCVIDGGPRHWTDEDRAALEDLRDALEAEVRLLQSGRAMIAMLRERDEQEAEKEQALRLLIHDLRSPVASVVSTLELFEAVPEEMTRSPELLPAVRRTLDDALQMLNQMLEVHKMQSGRIQPDIRSQEVNSLLLEVYQQMMLLAQGASQDLEFLPAPPELKVQADGMMLKRLLVNLLTNAVKYAGRGALIRLSARVRNDGVLLAVDDSGPGVPLHERERIFDAFEIGSVATGQHDRSFGLGLSFCRLAAEVHGGRIWYEESDLGGSRFCVLLPQSVSSGSNGGGRRTQAWE